MFFFLSILSSLFIYLFIHFCTGLFMYLSIYICLPMYLSIHLRMYYLIYLSIYWSSTHPLLISVSVCVCAGSCGSWGCAFQWGCRQLSAATLHVTRFSSASSRFVPSCVFPHPYFQSSIHVPSLVCPALPCIHLLIRNFSFFHLYCLCHHYLTTSILSISISVSFSWPALHHQRSIKLFLLGIILNSLGGWNTLATYRVPGVLQRFAICYLVTSSVALAFTPAQPKQYQVRMANVTPC